MALILRGKTECSICNAVINKNDEAVATTHFISDSNDPLWRFSDSVMHKSCFLNWEYREDFIDKYNESIGKIVWGNGTFHRMETDGHISVLEKES